MTKVGRCATPLVLATLSLLTGAHGVLAQQNPTDLNVVGLKLGMTIDQAKAVLIAHNPATQFATTYAFLDNGAVGELAEGGVGPTPPSGAILAPVAVLAGAASHMYGLRHQELTDGSGDPVYDVTGEWFSLRFTPNGDGGSLYAIARVVNYPSEDVDRNTLPAIAPFYDQLAATYGKPSPADNSGHDFDWAFDPRGRALPAGNKEFRRCHVDPVRPQGDGGRDGVPFALVGSDGSKIPSLPRSALLGLAGIEAISSFMPTLSGTYNAPGGNPQFRKCGTGLQVNVETSDDTHINNFTVFLADFDRAYFDDGVKKYLEGKTTAAPSAATPAL